MTESVQAITYLFAVCSVLLSAVLAFLFLSKVTFGVWAPGSMAPFLKNRALLLLTLTAYGGVALSLFYSEFVGFPVCVLCWLARMMMIPIAVIATVALVRKDTTVWPYTLTLSVLGMCVTLYHHLYQIGVVAGTLCTSVQNGGDCAQRYIYEFGFVTMPFMGFVLFATFALLSLVMRTHRIIEQ